MQAPLLGRMSDVVGRRPLLLLYFVLSTLPFTMIALHINFGELSCSSKSGASIFDQWSSCCTSVVALLSVNHSSAGLSLFFYFPARVRQSSLRACCQQQELLRRLTDVQPLLTPPVSRR